MHRAKRTVEYPIHAPSSTITAGFFFMISASMIFPLTSPTDIAPEPIGSVHCAHSAHAGTSLEHEPTAKGQRQFERGANGERVTAVRARRGAYT
eukprot:167400-Prymnesium_polylepis.1